MKPGYSLELTQTQKLALTPEMRQAIAMLQMNVLELSTFVRLQVEENPLLEIVEEPYEEALPETLDLPDDDWSQTYPTRQATESHPPAWEAFAQKSEDLKEHLTAQIRLVSLSPLEEDIGDCIIGNLDDNGYLRCRLEDIALITGASVDEVEEVLGVVQKFEPCGVAARDLRECLGLQSRALGLDHWVAGIIDEHLEDLATGRYKGIANDMNTSTENVIRARDTILSLNPKPGAHFSAAAIAYVYPEVTVRNVAGEIVVLYNDSAAPRLRWNLAYRRLLREGESDTRAYLVGQLRKARALMRNTQQRKNTILAVMECIVSRQAGFFREGPRRLGPLTMKDVALEVGMHESTVSRCVSNKYADTPFGVYPCKTFFSPKAASDATDVSQHTVKSMVRSIIQGEDPRHPVSDREVSARLARKGVSVARRTVAKYRAQLGILPSSRRQSV